MRVIVFSVLLLSSMSYAASVGLNPEIGINFAWYDPYPILTPNAGISVPVAIGRHEFRGGLRYSPKGERYDRDFSYAYWLHYIEMPLSYAYYPSFFKKKLGFSAGYSVSYLFLASIEDEKGYRPSSTLKSMYYPFDHGALFGIRYNQSIGKANLSFSLSYYQGIGVVIDKFDDMIIPKRNHALTALVGFYFPVFQGL
jgi:hypothetical protein